MMFSNPQKAVEKAENYVLSRTPLFMPWGFKVIIFTSFYIKGHSLQSGR
jgi:hypothetical protein